MKKLLFILILLGSYGFSEAALAKINLLVNASKNYEISNDQKYADISFAIIRAMTDTEKTGNKFLLKGAEKRLKNAKDMGGGAVKLPAGKDINVQAAALFADKADDGTNYGKLAFDKLSSDGKKSLKLAVSNLK